MKRSCTKKTSRQWQEGWKGQEAAAANQLLRGADRRRSHRAQIRRNSRRDSASDARQDADAGDTIAVGLPLADDAWVLNFRTYAVRASDFEGDARRDGARS